MAICLIPISAPDSKPTLRLAFRAEQDSHDILLYTHRKRGERQRTTYRTAIQRALRRLNDHPMLGQPQDESFPGCRSVQMGEHIIYYHQPRPEEIVVLRILLVRQDATGKVRP